MHFFLVSNSLYNKIIFVAFCFVSLAALACSTSQVIQTDEQRAQTIDKNLICPICPGETIDQSQVELAKQMKYAVREMIDKGQSDEEILNFFTERYGVSVLAAPPKEGFHLFAWWTPIGIVFVGITLTFIFIRSKTILKFNNQQIHISKDFMSSQEFQESLEAIEKTTHEFNSDITKEKE